MSSSTRLPPFDQLRQRVEQVAHRWPYPIWPLCALAIVLLSLVAVWPLLSGDMLLTGDTSHAIRIYEMHQCLSDGQLPCRWVPDLGNGYGYPLFNYYPPLPYYAGAALHRLGFSYVTSADLLAVLGLAGAGLSMFALARRFWGDLGGLVSAIAYMYAPYLALDIYMRGALGELWALAVLPALFLVTYELIDSARARFVPLLALLGALLLLSHNLVAVIAAPALALWAAAFLVRRGRHAVRPALLLSLAMLWAVGLAAFFTLPVLFEGNLVQLDTLSHFPFRYSDNFASVSDLFLLRSNDYSFLLGGRSGTPTQIGWFHWGLALLALPIAAMLYRSGRRTLSIVIALLALDFAIGVVMSVSASKSIWDQFDSLRFIQFPWRYLGLVSFATAALCGATFALLRGRSRWQQGVVATGLIALFILSGWTFFRPYHSCNLSDRDVLSASVSPGEKQDPICSKLIEAPWGAAITDYLPKAVRELPVGPPAAPATVVDGSARVAASERGSDWLKLDIEAAAPSRFDASIFEFPNWRARIDGKAVPHTASKPNGLIEFTVPAGRHRVELRLEDTNLRRLGNALSLVSWAALVLGVPAFAVGRRTVAPRRGGL
jgi:hypothetical protein